MKCYVTTMNEPTTDLCVWSLERNGFEVHVIDGDTLLSEKLKQIYDEASNDFIRVDADVIVNRNLTPDKVNAACPEYVWWLQFSTYGWFSQDRIYGGVQYIKADALPALQAHVDEFLYIDRPETQLSRISEFYNPRRFESNDTIVGIHGYGIKDLKPIIRQKANRGQSNNYDFELAQRLNEL